VLADNLTAALLDTLDRPDMRTLAERVSIRLDARLAVPFQVLADEVVLGRPVLERPDVAATVLRHAIELHGIMRCPGEKICPSLALCASARVAALFHAIEYGACEPRVAAPDWLAAFGGEVVPDGGMLAGVWPMLAALLPVAPPRPVFDGLVARLREVWPVLAPAEMLMGEGGDARLRVDPASGLNRYGCSHRPRPWAVTFASSTASSLSERGFGGAEQARMRLVRGVLAGQEPTREVRRLLVEARERIARYYGLGSADRVVLCASGTDCELAALALAADRAGERPIANIVIAPDETGSGVPLAAEGRHFAADTAGRDVVPKGGHIAGFPVMTRLIGVPLRRPDGEVRRADEIDEECLCLVRRELEAGHHVLLHHLDMSKTGLIGPGVEVLERVRAMGGERVDIVIDACQARLAPERVRARVDNGAMVLMTGSKFFTGPPFCGAVLLPAGVAARVRGMRPPVGLRDYANPGEWPVTADDGALGMGANVGLAVRWHAALAEMEAFAACDAEETRAIILRFTREVRAGIEAHPALTLLPPPPLAREDIGEDLEEACWDTIPTILSFLVAAPVGGGAMALEDTRRLYRWLNADLSAWAEGEVAGLLCHVGQPVPVPLGAHLAGALRISAGARLVSGEPSHQGIGHERRVRREIEDAGRILEKITLILTHWERLAAIDPQPCYAPAGFVRARTRENGIS